MPAFFISLIMLTGLSRIILTFLSVTSILSGCSKEIFNNPDKRVEINTIIQHFETSVFTAEYDDINKLDHIRKWTDPVRIKLSGNQSNLYEDTVRVYANALSQVTGLDMKIVNHGIQGHNIEIFFAEWDDIPNLAKPFSDNPDWIDTIIEDSGCLFIYHRNSEYIIKHGYIFISTDEPINEIKSCLLEEMMQILGFPNDSEVVRPSVLNSWDRLQQLAITDKLLLKALYDEELLPGTNKEEALKKVQIILNELIQ